MSDTNKHAILHYLDEPLRILYWTKEEIIFYIGIPFVGMIVDQELLGIVVPIVGALFHRAYKKRFSNINLVIMRYWYFPPNNRFQCIPASYIKNYIG